MNQYIITIRLPSGNTGKINVPANDAREALSLIKSNHPKAEIIEIELSIDSSS